MKNQIVELCRSLPMVVPLILTTSCATPALWKSTAAREWKPNPPDQVMMITDTNHQADLVVVFRQFATVGSTGDSRNVGWRVNRSPEELAVTKEAICQLTNSVRQCQSVPMFFEEPESPTVMSQSSGYVVWHSLDHQFTVHIPNLPFGPFTLPTSHQERQTALRVCVLPVAVAADAALVGAALCAVCLASGGGYVGP